MERITLNGTDIGLYYCLGAAKDLAALSGGLTNLSDFLNGADAAEVVDRVARIIMVLNKWYCKITGETEIGEDFLQLYIDPNDTAEYMGHVTDAIARGTKTEVKTQPVKTKNAESGQEA